MKLLTESLGSRHRLTWMVGAIALVSCALLGVAARAHASETIYWDNYNASPPTIGFANIDGNGGGILNTAAIEIDNPEGLAYDPTSGRIFIANSSKEQIDWVATDGSGSGVLDTTGAKVEDPEGIAVDPKTQTVYWANDETEGSIGYASANGGSGGLLNTAGTVVDDPYKIALDTTSNRVYWVGNEKIYFANLDNTGGGTLSYGPAEGPHNWSAINVDPAAGRLYFLGASPKGVAGIYWFNTSGVGGGEVSISAVSGETPKTYDDPFGLAFDPSNGRFVWANYGTGEDATNAFGTATLGLVGSGSIAITSAPLHSPQDPVIVRSPTGMGAPQISASGTALSCSQGIWSQDYPGSYVYGAPVSYSYQWSKDGQAISGVNGSALTATSSGSYTCAVTGTNRSGSASQSSSAYSVAIAPPITPAPASFALSSGSKKKVKVVAGKVASLPLTLKNAGGTTSSSSKVCVKLTKKAKAGLVAPKCVAVAALAPGASKKMTLKVKTKGGAKGTYKFSVVVSGASGSKTLAEQVTVTPKKHGKKKHGKK
ncbi:MAG: hypothetical protein JWO14_3758 [Solirubrobacterales bacterium]|nr:hypothetical protein [Solirubrobacterales bacterium]